MDLWPKFQYYWDYGVWPIGGEDMGSPSDIQRLILRAQRAQQLTDKAATVGTEADAIMSSFEQTMDRFNAEFGQMKEYEKQIAAMMGSASNGGPPLDATFPSTTEQPVPAPSTATATTTTVTADSSSIDHATGDPVKI